MKGEGNAVVCDAKEGEVSKSRPTAAPGKGPKSLALLSFEGRLRNSDFDGVQASKKRAKGSKIVRVDEGKTVELETCSFLRSSGGGRSPRREDPFQSRISILRSMMTAHCSRFD